jgi:hypothetical protein
MTPVYLQKGEREILAPSCKAVAAEIQKDLQPRGRKGHYE